MVKNNRSEQGLIETPTTTTSRRHLLAYFPLRYLLAAFFFAYVFQANVDILYQIEGYVVTTIFDNLSPVNLYYSEKALSSFSGNVSHEFAIPVFSQMLFLIFFPTMALVSRINLKKRIKILFYGMLCWLSFILIQVLGIGITLGLGLNVSPESYVRISIFATVTAGALMIELMLFSSLKLPSRTRVKPIIKRKYGREYAYLIVTLAGASLLVYALLEVLDITTDSPITAYFALNVVTIMIFSYYLSFFIYSLRPSARLKPNTDDGGAPCSISFLLPARNEEKIIERCLRSIDAAASKYSGITEIVVVNDGSTDDTEKIAGEILSDLKFALGKLINIPKSGKGYALQHGLEQTTGDIIFRIDADSVLDESAIRPIINHFKNPEVGCVSGMIFPLEANTVWQKSLGLMFVYYMSVIKRGQALFDSVLVQAGAFSVFRKDALLKIGGWAVKQFGEDGEITNRLGRYGYRNELELDSLLYSEVPGSLTHFIYQRSRWSIAFYHARGTNLDVVRKPAEYKSPRALVFLIALLTHGLSFAHGLVLPYIAATFLTGTLLIWLADMPSFLGFAYKFALLQGIIMLVQIAVIAYNLPRFKKLGHIKYYPMLRVMSFVLSTIVRPQALEILLSWSSKHKEYNENAYDELSMEMKKSVDPIGM